MDTDSASVEAAIGDLKIFWKNKFQKVPENKTWIHLMLATIYTEFIFC